MNDRELERLAERLGDRAAEQVDPERIAERVLSRLRDESTRARPWWARASVLRIAAALFLTMGGAVVGTRLLLDGGPSLEAPAAFLDAGIEALGANELVEVLDSLSAEAPAHQTVTAGLDDLTDGQLEELLERMEGEKG